MSLIPCKYFMRNECRFGDNCRFYHPRGGTQLQTTGFGGRQLTPSHFGQVQNQDASSRNQQNIATMIEMVKKDMQEWENCHIFPFSSYGPGSKPSLPGFEEISAEELRYRYLQNNKLPLDLSREVTLLQQTRHSYKDPTPLTRNILERVIVNGERIASDALSSATSPTQAFGSSNVFGSNNTNTNITGINSVFGGNTSPFGSNSNNASSSPWGNNATSQNNIFGQNQQQQSASPSIGIFGQSQAQTNNNNIFGNTSATTQQGFGQNLNQQQPSPFQTQSTAFQPQTNVFQQAQPQQSGLLFGTQSPTSGTSGSVFGTQGVATANSGSSLFGSPQASSQQSVFGASLFGNPQTQAIAQPTTSMFASPQSQQGSVFGVPNSGSTQQIGSIFGTPQNSLQQTGPLFGASATPPNTTGSLFGTPPVVGSPFGTASNPQNTQSLFGAPQNLTNPQAGSIFGTTPAPTTLNSSSGSLFGTTPAPTTPNPSAGSLFGATPTQTTPNPSTGSLFGTTPVQTTINSSTGSLFGTAPTTLNSSTGSLFGTAPATLNSSTGSLFGTQLNSPATGTPFGTGTTTTSSGGMFGSLTSSETITPNPSIFGTPPSNQSASLFGSVTPQTQLTSEQKYVYSIEAELTPEEIEAFKSPHFTIESIPVKPPPRSMCM